MGLLLTVTVQDELAVVRDRIAATLTKKAPGWFGGSQTFRGRVADDGFRVTRNFVWGERSMPIVAEGRFTSAEGGGTTVTVTTRLDPLSWVFVAFIGLWSGGWLLMICHLLFVSPHPGGVHRGEIALFAGFAVFGWAVLFLGLAYEKDLYRHALKQILAPEAVAPNLRA